MDFSDLRAFVTATRHASLQEAAGELHITPSALSKTIRRLEGDLRAPLFDRSGKAMRLNATGKRLRERALSLLDMVEQTRAEFEGASFRVQCRIGGPPILQWRHGPALTRTVARLYADSSVLFKPQYEDEALQGLLRGELDFALVTGEALRNAPAGAALHTLALGGLEMQLAAARTHPLAAGAKGRTLRLSSKRLLAHDFVSPSRSIFCGVPRGARSDGWHEDVMPRRVRYWADDLQVLLALVRDGAALAYLPAFTLAQEDFVAIRLTDCPFRCTEEAHLAWRPSEAMGWQVAVVGAMRDAPRA